MAGAAKSAATSANFASLMVCFSFCGGGPLSTHTRGNTGFRNWFSTERCRWVGSAVPGKKLDSSKAIHRDSTQAFGGGHELNVLRERTESAGLPGQHGACRGLSSASLKLRSSDRKDSRRLRRAEDDGRCRARRRHRDESIHAG